MSQHSGRPSTSIDNENINKIKEMVLGNRRLTIRELVDMVGIAFGSMQTILKDHLGLNRVKSRSVPKFLNFFEKERRFQACKAMFSDYQGDKQIYAYDSETTDQSSEYRLKGEANLSKVVRKSR